MNDKDRCSCCGSWEAECSFDEPQDGCSCARCANFELNRLKDMIARSNLKEVEATRVKHDSCGKPVIVKDGTMFVQRDVLEKQSEITSLLQKMSQLSIELAGYKNGERRRVLESEPCTCFSTYSGTLEPKSMQCDRCKELYLLKYKYILGD
jgi:hypothetical protein